MNALLTPWSRGALGDEHIRRLRFHLAPDCRLVVIGKLGWFTVRIYGRGRTFERTPVPRAGLWETIVEGLGAIGFPLEPDEEWAKTQAALYA